MPVVGEEFVADAQLIEHSGDVMVGEAAVAGVVVAGLVPAHGTVWSSSVRKIRS
jgi:hypothetical protein